MTNPEPRKDSDAPTENENDVKTPFSVADRWWWSGTFRTVLGVIIAYLQWEPISQGPGNWMNWVMFVIGAAVAIWGIVVLIRDYDEHTKSS